MRRSVETAVSFNEQEKQLATFANHLALGQIETCRAIAQSSAFPQNEEAFADILSAAVLRQRRIISASKHSTSNNRRTVVSSSFRIATSSIAPSIEAVSRALANDSQVAAHVRTMVSEAKRRGELESCNLDEQDVEDYLNGNDSNPAAVITVGINLVANAAAGICGEPHEAQQAGKIVEQLCDFILEHDGDPDSLYFCRFVGIYEYLHQLITKMYRRPCSVREDDVQEGNHEDSPSGQQDQAAPLVSEEDAWSVCGKALNILWNAARVFASRETYRQYFNARGGSALEALTETYSQQILKATTKAHLLTIFYPPPPGHTEEEGDVEAAGTEGLAPDMLLMDSAKSEAAHLAILNTLLPHSHLHCFLDTFLLRFDAFDEGDIANHKCLQLPPPLVSGAGQTGTSPQRPNSSCPREEWSRYVRCLLAHNKKDMLSQVSSLVVRYLTASTGSDGKQGEFFSVLKQFLEHPALTALRPFVCVELYGRRDHRLALFVSHHHLTFDDHVLLIDFLTTPVTEGNRSKRSSYAPSHPCAYFTNHLNVCLKLASFLIKNNATVNTTPAKSNPALSQGICNASAELLFCLLETDIDILPYVFSAPADGSTRSAAAGSSLRSGKFLFLQATISNLTSTLDKAAPILPTRTAQSLSEQVMFMRTVLLMQFCVDSFADKVSTIPETVFTSLTDLTTTFASSFTEASHPSTTAFCDVVVNLCIAIFSRFAVEDDEDTEQSAASQRAVALTRFLHILLDTCQAIISPITVSTLRDMSFRAQQLSDGSIGGVGKQKNPLTASPLSFLLAAVEGGDYDTAHRVVRNLFMVQEKKRETSRSAKRDDEEDVHSVLVFAFLTRRLQALQRGDITLEEFKPLLAEATRKNAPLSKLLGADVFFHLPEISAHDPTELLAEESRSRKVTPSQRMETRLKDSAGSVNTTTSPTDPTVVFEKFLSVSLKQHVSSDEVAKIVAAIDRARRIAKSTNTTIDELGNILDFMKDQEHVWCNGDSTTTPTTNFLHISLQFLKQLSKYMQAGNALSDAAGSNNANSPLQLSFLMNDAVGLVFDAVASGRVTHDSYTAMDGAATQDDSGLFGPRSIVRIVHDQYLQRTLGKGSAPLLKPEEEANVLRFMEPYLGTPSALLLLYAVSADPLKTPFTGQSSQFKWLADYLRGQALVAHSVTRFSERALHPQHRTAAILDPNRLQEALDEALYQIDSQAPSSGSFLVALGPDWIVPSAKRQLGSKEDGHSVVSRCVECLLTLTGSSATTTPIPPDELYLNELYQRQQRNCASPTALAVRLLMALPAWPARATFVIPPAVGDPTRRQELYALGSSSLPYSAKLALLDSIASATLGTHNVEALPSELPQQVVAARHQVHKARELSGLLSSLPTERVPAMLLVDPLPFHTWTPETIAAISDDLSSKGFIEAAIGFLTVLIRDSVHRDEAVVQTLVTLHSKRLMEIVEPATSRSSSLAQEPSPASRRSRRLNKDVSLLATKYVHSVIMDEFSTLNDAGEVVIDVSPAVANGTEAKTVTVQLIEAFIKGMSFASRLQETNVEEPVVEEGTGQDDVATTAKQQTWGVVERVLRCCHTSPLVAPLFANDPQWKHALVGIEALISLEKIISLRGGVDHQLNLLMDGAFISHPVLLLENLIASERVVEAAKIISDVPALQEEKAFRKILIMYARAACDMSSYDFFHEDEFPNGKTKGESLDRALKRDPPLTPSAVRIVVHPSFQSAELRRVRGMHKYASAPNMPLFTLLLHLCTDQEFAQEEAYNIAAEMFESLGEYDSDVTKAVVIEIAERVVQSLNPSGDREQRLLKKFQISRHLVVCGWKEHPMHADLDSDEGVMRLVGQLLQAQQAKAAFSIADACGMDIGAVESLWVDRTIQLLRLGLFEEAQEAASHLQQKRVQREVFDVVVKTPVTFGYSAIRADNQLAVKKVPAETGREMLSVRQLGLQQLIEKFGEVQDLLAFHVRCGSMDEAVNIIMQRQQNAAAGAGSLGNSTRDGFGRSANDPIPEGVFVETVVIPAHKMKADGLLRDAFFRYDPSLVSVRPLLLSVGKYLDRNGMFEELLVWQHWMCDYVRAAQTAAELGVREKLLARKLQYFSFAEKMTLEAKFQPQSRKATGNTSDSGVVLPPRRADGEALQQGLIRCKLQAELCSLLHSDKQDFNKYSLYIPDHEVEAEAPKLVVELMCTGKNFSSIALQITSLFRLRAASTVGSACQRLIANKKMDLAESIVDHVKRSMTLSVENKNEVVLEVIKICVVEGPQSKQSSKIKKWSEALLNHMTSDGGFRVRAMLELGKLMDAHGEAVALQDCKLVSLVYDAAVDAAPQTTTTKHVAELAQQYLARYDMR